MRKNLDIYYKKVAIIIFVFTLLFALFCSYAPTWLYFFVLLYLGSEYFLLLGSYLNWLNTRKESDFFEETITLRSILMTDARLILICASLSFFVLFENQELNHQSLMIRILLSALVVHAIHSILMFEKLGGVSYIKYPPLAYLIKKMFDGIRKRLCL